MNNLKNIYALLCTWQLFITNGNMFPDLSNRCVFHSSIAIFFPQSFAHLFIINMHNNESTVNKKYKHFKVQINIYKI